MKKINLVIILALLAQNSFAHDAYFNRGYNHGFNQGFNHRYFPERHLYRPYGYVQSYNILPALALGGLFAYSISQPRPINQTIIYPPAPATTTVITSPSYGLGNSNEAMVYSAPAGYRYEQVFDATCNCFNTVLIPE